MNFVSSFYGGHVTIVIHKLFADMTRTHMMKKTCFEYSRCVSADNFVIIFQGTSLPCLMDEQMRLRLKDASIMVPAKFDRLEYSVLRYEAKLLHVVHLLGTQRIISVTKKVRNRLGKVRETRGAVANAVRRASSNLSRLICGFFCVCDGHKTISSLGIHKFRQRMFLECQSESLNTRVQRCAGSSF